MYHVIGSDPYLYYNFSIVAVIVQNFSLMKRITNNRSLHTKVKFRESISEPLFIHGIHLNKAWSKIGGIVHSVVFLEIISGFMKGKTFYEHPLILPEHTSKWCRLSITSETIAPSLIEGIFRAWSGQVHGILFTNN